MTMLVCSVNNVTKSYGGNRLFNNVSIEIKEKERIGLIGRNGSGKSTFIRLIAGEEKPDAGQIHWKKGATIGYLKQIPDFHDTTKTNQLLRMAFAPLLEIEKRMKKLEAEMGVETDVTRQENVMKEYGDLQDQFTGNGGYEIASNIEKVAQGLTIHHLLDQPFSELSGGEKTKVGLAFMLLKTPDLLLLDEPTNHLDLMAVEWLGDFLRSYSGTVVVISHDRYFLDEVVNKVLDLEDGEITTYLTNFTHYVKEKEAKILREFQAYEEQQKKIKKMKAAIKQLRDWANRANPPNAALHRRAKNMEKALERIEQLQRPITHKSMQLEMGTSDRSGKDVVMLKDVSKQFGNKILFEKVNMHLIYQDRAAIIGGNGSGKSSLLKLILEQLHPEKGEVKVGSNIKIGYVSQDIFPKIATETVMERFKAEVNVTEAEARSMLAKFMFYGYDVFQKVSQLSGGERMRLRLAQLMHQDINFLILDEPTNHLDIESKEVLEETLDHFEGSILAVSHDRYFLNKLFNKIYWIEACRMHCFTGDYHWAKEKMAEWRDQHMKKASSKTSPKQKNVRREKQQSSNNDVIEQKLLIIESRILAVDKELLEESAINQLQHLYHEKEQLELEWEMLCDQLDMNRK